MATKRRAISQPSFDSKRRCTRATITELSKRGGQWLTAAQPDPESFMHEPRDKNEKLRQPLREAGLLDAEDLDDMPELDLGESAEVEEDFAKPSKFENISFSVDSN
jgi:hypothetical protein